MVKTNKLYVMILLNTRMGGVSVPITSLDEQKIRKEAEDINNNQDGYQAFVRSIRVNY
jgi:hypothetical protein